MDTAEWVLRNIAFGVLGIAGFWAFWKERKISLMKDAERDRQMIQFIKELLQIQVESTSSQSKLINTVKKIDETVNIWGKKTQQEVEEITEKFIIIEQRTENLITAHREDTIRREATQRARGGD